MMVKWVQNIIASRRRAAASVIWFDKIVAVKDRPTQQNESYKIETKWAHLTNQVPSQ